MPKRYPDAKIDEALLAYYTLGTYEKAGEATGVPWRTIADWVVKHHKDRYDELVAKHGPTLERQTVAKFARTAARAADITDQGLEATRAALARSEEERPKRENYDDPKDYETDLRFWQIMVTSAAKDASAYSGAAKNAALVAGIATDKKLTLEGRPTLITQHQDTDDILRSLSALGVVIEGTATEAPQQQIEAPSQPTSTGATHRQTQDKRVSVPRSA